MAKILGISAFYHDSAAAVVNRGKIECAVQEERFTRKKHDPAFPANSVKFCVENAGEPDYVVFYDKPFLKFERILKTFVESSPRGFRAFSMRVPQFVSEKLDVRGRISREMTALLGKAFSEERIFFSSHHLSHAASAFFPSPFRRAAIVTLDGVGEYSTGTISRGVGRQITVLREMDFPDSVGLFYSAFTQYCGFKVNSGEYKAMGLAPYADVESGEPDKMISLIKENLVEISEDGSIRLALPYFSYLSGEGMVNGPRWRKLFGFPARDPEGPLRQEYCDLAHAAQKVTEEIVLKVARHAKKITGERNACFAGGVALNAVANGEIKRSKIFDKVWFQPASGDSGGAVGAALAFSRIFLREKKARFKGDLMGGAYLGPEFSDSEIEAIGKKYPVVSERLSGKSSLAERISSLISKGKVVGLFQGRMEFGPRALGNRSILGDPRSPETQRTLNLKIKKRESFRPFAPSVIEEKAGDYFEDGERAPYMITTTFVKKNLRRRLPKNHSALPPEKKLRLARSAIPAITHVDFSARVQTVSKETNPLYWKIIDSFGKKTGVFLVVNTSFNVRGEPIVLSPDDAFRCFLSTEMDYLAIGSALYSKKKVK